MVDRVGRAAQRASSLSSSGLISGTPTEVVQGKPVGIRVSDTSGRSTVRNYEISIRAPLAVTVTPAQPPIAQIGQPFKFGPFVPTGGAGPYTLTLASGTPPAGVTLVPATASLEGTPTQAGTLPRRRPDDRRRGAGRSTRP